MGPHPQGVPLGISKLLITVTVECDVHGTSTCPAVLHRHPELEKVLLRGAPPASHAALRRLDVGSASRRTQHVAFNIIAVFACLALTAAPPEALVTEGVRPAGFGCGSSKVLHASQCPRPPPHLLPVPERWGAELPGTRGDHSWDLRALRREHGGFGPPTWEGWSVAPSWVGGGPGWWAGPVLAEPGSLGRLYVI